MHHLLVDDRELPANLRLKMPEFLNFVENFRSILVGQGFVSRKNWQKKEAKQATLMLSVFLYNVLQDNASLIRRHEKLSEETEDQMQKVRLLNNIDKFLDNGAGCIT